MLALASSPQVPVFRHLHDLALSSHTKFDHLICPGHGPACRHPSIWHSSIKKSKEPDKRLLTKQQLHPIRCSHCAGILTATGGSCQNTKATVGDLSVRTTQGGWKNLFDFFITVYNQLYSFSLNADGY